MGKQNYTALKLFSVLVFFGTFFSTSFYLLYQQGSTLTYQVSRAHAQSATLDDQLMKTKISLASTAARLREVTTDDQYVINRALEKEIADIEKSYKDAVSIYEELLKLKEMTTKTVTYDEAFTGALDLLAERKYATAVASLSALKTEIQKKKTEIAAAFVIPANVPVNNAAPGSGYQRQQVQTDVGTFLVDVIAADLNTARVIVDTASDGTCRNDCPVMNLGDYAARSGAFAAINGPYFCPSTYPSCQDKKNSFDTLLMNKNKVYFNSENNVYSTVPAVIFSGSSARWVGQSLEWGRDTGVDSVIANQPLMVRNGGITFGGDSEIKRAGKGSRSFIGSSGSTAYIGIVHNANVAEAAKVVHTMGIQNALNLDSGGSTALWSNGRYLAGPGRALPFGILFVRK